MNSKKIRQYSISLLLASIILFASAVLYSSYQFGMMGTIKAEEGPEDPLEAWSEASYIIWKYNTTHYAARNMSTLLVDFGPSTNATEVIQNAMDNVVYFGTEKEQGAKILLKGNTKYVLQAPLTTPKYDHSDQTLVLEGEDMMSTILYIDPSEHDYAFLQERVAFEQTVTLRNLRFQGRGVHFAYGDYKGVPTLLEHLFFDGVNGTAMNITYHHPVTIRDVTVLGDSWDAQNINYTDYGIWAYRTNNIRIESSKIMKCLYDGIYIQRVTSFTITNTVSEWCGTSGSGWNVNVQGQGSSATYAINIQGSYFEAGADGEIWLNDNVLGGEISGSFIGTAMGATGILLNDTQGVAIQNNEFQSEGKVGITIGDDSTDNTIGGNYFYAGLADPPIIVDNSNNNFENNFDFIVKNSGTAEASDTDTISFGVTFAGTPQTVVVTVNEFDARYIAQACNITTTGFDLYLYDETAGALEGVDKTISYYARYHP